MKINLKIIEDFTYPLYCEEEFIQEINFNTFLQLRVDIRELNNNKDQSISGYYLLIKNRKLHILKNGKIATFTESGIFDGIPRSNFEFYKDCMFKLF